MNYFVVKGVDESPRLAFSVSGFPTIYMMIKSMSKIKNVGVLAEFAAFLCSELCIMSFMHATKP